MGTVEGTAVGTGLGSVEGTGLGTVEGTAVGTGLGTAVGTGAWHGGGHGGWARGRARGWAWCWARHSPGSCPCGPVPSSRAGLRGLTRSQSRCQHPPRHRPDTCLSSAPLLPHVEGPTRERGLREHTFPSGVPGAHRPGRIPTVLLGCPREPRGTLRPGVLRGFVMAVASLCLFLLKLNEGWGRE